MMVFRQELPSYPLRAVLDEAADALGDEALAELLAQHNVTRAELNDPLHWLSLEFVEWLFASIEERLQDPTFTQRASVRSTSREYIGPVLPLVAAFGTPLFTFRQLPKASRRLNKLATWVVESARPGAVRLVWVPTPAAPRERTRHLCKFRCAQLAAIPKLFDQPMAHVEHPECMLDGAATCVYDIRWQEPPARKHGVIGLLCGLLLGAALGMLAPTPWWHASTVLVMLAVAGFAFGRWIVLRHDVRYRTRELDEQNHALDRVMRSNEQRYAELLDAKADVDRQVERRTTELKQASQRLMETLGQIQALDRAKTDFFNNVSHELRTPLTMILAPLEDLVVGKVPPGGESAAFAAMHRSALRLLRLINQLLDLAKVDAGGVQLVTEWTDLSALLRTVLTAFEPAAAARGVSLELEIVTGVQPIVIDPSWIESALTNLIANALRHTPRAGRVQVLLQDAGSDVTFAVSDTGAGIAAADHEKVFDRFTQSDTTSAGFGTGIGLALVREAARLHGGAVKLDSALGEGSRFTMTLPRRTETAKRPERLPPRAATIERFDLREPPERSDRPGPTNAAPLALVVEDDADLRELIANVLSPHYRVVAAIDGNQALAHARELAPDVIVSDVAMPGLNGYELCRALRADDATRAIPLLLVTARVEVASVLEGFEAGANDYVLKPFHGRELLARVDVHVRLRRMMQEFMLRERQAMLGAVAASVAHLVRNPLTALISGLPAMRTRLASNIDTSTREVIDVMFDCAQRIERTTADLLDLSNLDCAMDEYCPSDGLGAAIRLAKARGAITVRVEDKIEACPRIHGSAADMNYVFLSLIDNALRAVGNGGQVRVDAAVRSAVYVVQIGDSGPGVAPALSDRIFEPFFTTRALGEGTGLGLTIARRLLRECGGSIELGHSELGGAQFTVHVPVRPPILAVS